MFLNTTGRPYPALTARSVRPQLGAVLAVVFSAGLVAGVFLPKPSAKNVDWQRGPRSFQPGTRATEEKVFGSDGNAILRQPVDVVRVVDGDTFEARVHPWPGLEIATRVRLRGIDAPELKARCADELQRAEAASDALQALLKDGGVTIFNIGPDKYNGRVVADVATRTTPNVSAVLLAAGHARRYDGGHRDGWCATAFRTE